MYNLFFFIYQNFTVGDGVEHNIQGINLNPLENFIHRVFLLSEETISVLQSDCDEACFALKSRPEDNMQLEKSRTCGAMQMQSPSSVNKKNSDKIELENTVGEFNKYGVHSSLVKTLKVYHTYLKMKIDENKTKDKKNEDAIKEFLVGFNQKCSERQQNISQLDNMVGGFLDILKSLENGELNSHQKKELKTKYSILNSDYETLFPDEKEIKRHENFSPSINPLGKSGWMSNGIWNDFCLSNLKEPLKTLCIRYSNKKQLISFFEVLQELQRMKYKEVLVKYFLFEIIEDTKKFLKPESKEFTEIYKMCSTIIQIINPKVPVLVKID